MYRSPCLRGPLRTQKREHSRAKLGHQTTLPLSRRRVSGPDWVASIVTTTTAFAITPFVGSATIILNGYNTNVITAFRSKCLTSDSEATKAIGAARDLRVAGSCLLPAMEFGV